MTEDFDAAVNCADASGATTANIASANIAPTGTTPADATADKPVADWHTADPQFQRLRTLVKKAVGAKPFSELSAVAFDHEGSVLSGHALLDACEEAGFMVGDFDAVGALTAAGVPFVVAMVDAAASRGEQLDGFSVDFVYPSVKGPSIRGKRVLLLDAWLSDTSYIQTSSIVTLTAHNELDLDFGVIRKEGAQIVGIAALVGGGNQPAPATISVVDPTDDTRAQLPFIHVFDFADVKAE